MVWLAESFGVSEESAAYRLVNLGFGDDIEDSAAGHQARQAPAESRSKREGLVEAIHMLKEQQETLRRIRMQLGLAPVMADAERGVTEVGPAMRSRLAKALEDGLRVCVWRTFGTASGALSSCVRDRRSAVRALFLWPVANVVYTVR